MHNDPMKKNGLDHDVPSQNKNVRPGRLTRGSGIPVANNTDSQSAGARGPLTVEDHWLFEKHAHFNREVIPERRMHAKGWGAWGTFRVTHDITRYTYAKLFSKVGNECRVIARFSTVAGERGAADAERDIRGFAVRFYTEDGNWDIVGNNTPVFFFRDPKLFIELNHAVHRDPHSNLRSANTNWDFWSSLPESLLQVTLTMSDRGIPSSFRYMHGFGSHTYSMINADGVRSWVKFHFRSRQGVQNLTDQEAAMVVAKDRESNGRDLQEAINEGKFPRWKLYIQVMTEEQARAMKNNPFDLTKMWPKKDFPFIEVGELELNRNPDNYFQDIEQLAMDPSNQVPGIGISPDRMLQLRTLSYADAQRYRLGINYHQIPVNSPLGVKEPHPYHRDGQMRVDGNSGDELAYYPNSQGDWESNPEVQNPSQDGGRVDYYDFREDDHDYFTQPGQLFRAMTPEQQLVLAENTARNMGDATMQIKHRHIRHCHLADPKYGRMVAEALGIDIDTVDLSTNGEGSYEDWLRERARDKDLDYPTEPADPQSARDLPAEGRDTNVPDPASLTAWETDP